MKKLCRRRMISLITLIMLPLFFIACKKDSDDDLPIIPSGPATVTDIDGNTYNTVKIGNQTWMAENLKTKKYKDGVVLEFLEDFS